MFFMSVFAPLSEQHTCLDSVCLHIPNVYTQICKSVLVFAHAALFLRIFQASWVAILIRSIWIDLYLPFYSLTFKCLLKMYTEKMPSTFLETDVKIKKTCLKMLFTSNDEKKKSLARNPGGMIIFLSAQESSQLA